MYVLCSLCNEQTEVKLSRNTKMPICGACGGEPTISSFMIVSMKSNSDWWETKKGQAFSFKCEHCDETTPATASDDHVVCSVCNNDYSKMSAIMIRTVKGILQKQAADAPPQPDA